MDMKALAQQVKVEAQRLGFTLVGITSPDPPESYSVYQAWVVAGHHGEMGYLASERNLERRSDPRKILPECESILVLGIPYHHPNHPPPPLTDGPHGRVAAYAWGTDYHDTLKPRLQALVCFIETAQGKTVPNRWYTDTGPILERDLAQRAGLGWIGKNSLLINPNQGSTFLLAEILLGIPLPPDQPFVTDHCGECRACIDACPTACILPNRTLDATRCISYFTIEAKGAIPEDLRALAGEWVFGCDICQQVCPWNIRFAPLAGDPAFAPRKGTPMLDLTTTLQQTQAQFSAQFKGSPIKRSKRRGLARNVAVGLGNVGDKNQLAELRAATQHDEGLVHEHAQWAIEQIEQRR